MYGITDLKTGVVFEYENQPYVVLDYQHSKLGRGGAVLRSKIKNLITGVIVERTFKGNDKFAPVQIERKKAQFLYQEDNTFLFMDSETYDQFSLEASTVGLAKNYLLDGETYSLQFYKGKAISLELPVKMPFTVIQASEGLRGDTATAATKNVKLETGLNLNVPLFIKQGDRVVVDTRDGSYVEREK